MYADYPYCHSLRGSVDWNNEKNIRMGMIKSSLPAWECGLKSISNGASKFPFKSLPAWECGLKYPNREFMRNTLSHSLRGSVDWNCLCPVPNIRLACHSLRGSVDWNYIWQRYSATDNRSLPAWECGLKYFPFLFFIFWDLSLPAWECGLKLWLFGLTLSGHKVTPCVGVWIEI